MEPFCYAHHHTSTRPSHCHFSLNNKIKHSLSICDHFFVPFFFFFEMLSRQSDVLQPSQCASSGSFLENKRRSDSSPSCLQNGGDQRQWALLSAWEHTHFDPLLLDLHSALWFQTKAFVLVLTLQTGAFKERCSSATFLKHLFQKPQTKYSS